MKHRYDRRLFIKQAFHFSVLVTLGGVAACNSKKPAGEPSKAATDTSQVNAKPADPCDLQALTEKDLANRKALGYVEHTPIPEKNCENCKLYLPPNESKQCGTCPLFKGPVAQKGYCTYWADPAT